MADPNIELGEIQPEEINNPIVGEAQAALVNSATQLGTCERLRQAFRKTITPRSLLMSLFVMILITSICMKLNLTTGIIPSLDNTAILVGLLFMKIWAWVGHKFEGDTSVFSLHEFTKEETALVHGFVVAATGIAFSGGFGSYILAMSEATAAQCVSDARREGDTKDPDPLWIIFYLLPMVVFGMFVIVFRRMMIIDCRLPYPSGTESGNLINNLQTTQRIRGKIRLLILSSIFSFIWGFFQWFFYDGTHCSFAHFIHLDPIYNFDFSATYVGVGMIQQRNITVSMLLSAIFSRAIMWPIFKALKGKWYPADYDPDNLKGFDGYKVFISIAIIVGDGSYSIVKFFFYTLPPMWRQCREWPSSTFSQLSPEDSQRNVIFSRDQAYGEYYWVPIISAVAVALSLPIILGWIFPSQMEWAYPSIHFILIIPILALGNAYGCGLREWDLDEVYGYLAILSIVGLGEAFLRGGVVPGMVICGITMVAVSTSQDVMKNLKTAHITSTSPWAMLFSHLIGGLLGCIVSSLVFWTFFKSKQYPVPHALVYRNMAAMAGSLKHGNFFSLLPNHAFPLCIVFFFGAIAVNCIRDYYHTNNWVKLLVPIPTAAALALHMERHFAIDIFIGSMILLIWNLPYFGNTAQEFIPCLASGLFVGEAISTLMGSILSVLGVNPHACGLPVS